MGKPDRATPRKPSGPRPYSEAAEAALIEALTLRLPGNLLARIDARVTALNADKRLGRWSRNAFIVFALEAALNDEAATPGPT